MWVPQSGLLLWQRDHAGFGGMWKSVERWTRKALNAGSGTYGPSTLGFYDTSFSKVSGSQAGGREGMGSRLRGRQYPLI